MRSFILRIYRRGRAAGGVGISGTVQAVGDAATQPPQAFADAAELLLHIGDGRQLPTGARGPATPPTASTDGMPSAPPSGRAPT